MAENGRHSLRKGQYLLPGLIEHYALTRSLPWRMPSQRGFFLREDVINYVLERVARYLQVPSRLRRILNDKLWR